MGPGGVSCGTPRRKGEDFVFKAEKIHQNSPATSLSQPHVLTGTQARSPPKSQSHARPLSRSPGHDRAPDPVGEYGHGSSQGSSSTGGDDQDKLTSSSQADPIQTPFFMQQSSAPSSAVPRRNSGPPHTQGASAKPQKKDRASPFIHNKLVNQPMIGDSDNFRHQLYNHSHMQSIKKSPLHPPEVIYKSPPQEGKPQTQSHSKSTEDRFSSSNFIPDDFSTEFQEDEGGMSPSAIAAAKASALRIDSAYAAAECMKASLQAEVDSLSPEDTNKTETTMAMLDVMMKSLEKSKLSLDDIIPSPAKEECRSKGSESSGGDSRGRGKPSRRSKQHQHQHTNYQDRGGGDSEDDASNSDDNKYSNRQQDQEERGALLQSHRRRNNRGRDKGWPSSGTKSKSTPRANYGSPAPSPDMDMLRTNELHSLSNSSEGGEERWDHDEDNMDQMPFGQFSTSHRGHYDSSPNRVYTSTLLEESSGGAFGQTTVSKADFSELKRFGKSTDRHGDEQEHLSSSNATSAGNRNVAAAVVARYNKSKSGQPAQGEVPRVWRICLSQGPLLKVSILLRLVVACGIVPFLSFTY